MVFKRRKRYFRKRRVFRKKAFKRFARRVYKAVTYKAEKKILGITVTAQAINNSGYLLLLNQVTQGVQKNQRIGNKIKERFLKIKMSIAQNTANLFSDRYRLAIVRGRTSGLAIGDAPISTLTQPWDIDKWHVLRDSMFTLGNSSNDGNNIRNHDWTVRLGGREIMYNDSVSVSPVTNPLYLFIWCGSPGVDPTMDFDALYTYTDV
jgi:hypothetical protein